MLQIQIVCFVIILGLFRQPFANATSAAVSTPEKLTIDTKNIKKSDIGFSVQTKMSKCRCPDNVDLNENKSNGEIEYNKLDSKDSFVCCTNCVSVISAPPGYQLEVTKSLVQFQNDSKASLTIRNGKGNDGSVLRKLDNNNKVVPVIISSANIMTVSFRTRNTASSCRKVYYKIDAKLKKVPTPPSQTFRSLSSDQPFYLIRTRHLNMSNLYWTVTAETGKQVHLYLYGETSDWFGGSFFVIDGTNVNGTIISQVTQLSASSKGPLTVSSSSHGCLTILLDFAPVYSYMDVILLFTQLENDPSQCGTSKLVYISSESDPAVKVSISNHGGGTASCTAVLVTTARFLIFPGIQLNISSLQGSMVLYGGLDYPPSSKNEIERFSSMDDILPMETAGEVFLVQLNPGSMINFSFKTHTFFSYNYGSFIPKNIDTNYGVGKTSSPGFSLRGIYIIVCAAVLVPSLLIRCLAPLCKPRSEENDANLTVLTVHLIPSQPNEDDPPSP